MAFEYEGEGRAEIVEKGRKRASAAAIVALGLVLTILAPFVGAYVDAGFGALMLTGGIASAVYGVARLGELGFTPR